MPADNGFGFNNRQRAQNAWRKMIKTSENETINIAENEPFRGLPSQHIQLLAQHKVLGFERSL
jgi:hypothetical protein